jgi:PAS domain S-box-containing protein
MPMNAATPRFIAADDKPWPLAAGLVAAALVQALLMPLAQPCPSPLGPLVPFAPAAGLALAAGARWGWTAVPALGLGAWLGSWGQDPVAGGAAVAATLVHAAVAAHRLAPAHGADQLLLQTPRQMARHLALPAGLAAMLGALAGAVVAWTSGQPAHAAALRAGGDLAGMLVMAPAALSAFGSPRAAWHTRRWTLGLPLCMAAALLLGALAFGLPAQLPGTGASGHAAWLAVSGAAGVALLGLLLLLGSGHMQRVEAEVSARTAQLEREAGERQRAEAALAQRDSELRNIFDTVSIGIVQVAPDRYIRNANPAFCQLVGHALDDLRQMTIDDITPPADWHLHQQLAATFEQADRQVFQMNKHYRARDGRLLPVQVTTRVVRDAAGAGLYTVSAVRDLRDELRLREAERMRDRAETANRMKSDFVARMSHELRTPLNAILGFAQLLDNQVARSLTPTQRDWLERLQQAGWHLLAMISDVLDLSRVEADTLKMNLQPLPVAEAVGGSAAMVQEAAWRRGIAIDIAVDPDAAVMGDPVRVRQVLINLLSNAVKYNRERGRVEVRCRRAAGPLVEIEVADTGLGMSEAQQVALFEPFNRLGREGSGVEGTGIGLVIARRLAELMGGALRVRSSEGMGSVFTLVLPAAPPGSLAAAAAPAAVRAAEASPREHAPCRVLYIEDNETSADIMRGMLAQRPQVALQVAGTGRAGLQQARRERPDLVLLDLQLPDLPGQEVLRLLKDDPQLASIPVIVTSSNAMGTEVQAALAAGAADFLAKPLDLGVLLQAVDLQVGAGQAA